MAANNSDETAIVGGLNENTAVAQPLRLNDAGELLVTGGGGGGGGTSSDFGDPFPTAGTAAGFVSDTGTMAGANLDAAGNLLVNVAAGGAGGGDVNLTEVGGSAIAIGQAAMADSLPVVMASDQSAVPVSGPLTDAELRATPVPVSGTVATGGLTDAQLRATPVPVTANAGTNLNTSALATEATLSSLNGKVTAVNTGAVTISAALPAGTNNIGDVDVVSIVPLTGATNLGKAEDGGHTTGDVGVFALAVRQDTPNTAVTNTDADYSQVSVSSTGGVRFAPISEDFAALANGPQVKKYYTNAGAVTDGIVWSPAGGKRWYATDIFIGVSEACTVTLEDDLAAGDAVVFKMEFAANSGWSHGFVTPWFSGEDAADLLVTTTAGNVYITLTGYEI